MVEEINNDRSSKQINRFKQVETDRVGFALYICELLMNE